MDDRTAAAAATSERLDPLAMTGASRYDRETLALHLQRYELAATHAANRDVVDCACGTGYGSEMLAKAGARSVQGVDLDAGAIAFAQAHHAHAAVSYVQADALTWRAAPAPTVWVSLETIEHLPDPATFVRSVAAQVEPGGILIASVPVTVSTDGNPHHLHDFTKRGFRRLLQDHGFSVGRELRQEHRFTLADVFGGGRGERQHDRRRSLVGWYASHPTALARRAWLTLTRGLVHEYLTVVARREVRGTR
jgi:SAM-dependent methyltransferase